MLQITEKTTLRRKNLKMFYMENKPDSALVVNTDQISRLAYDLWEKAGRPSGRDTEFWLEAEKQLRAASGTSEKPKLAVAKSLPAEPAPASSKSSSAPALPNAAIPSLPQTTTASKPSATDALPNASAKTGPAEPAPAKGARVAAPAPAAVKAKDDTHKGNRIHSEPTKSRTRGARP